MAGGFWVLLDDVAAFAKLAAASAARSSAKTAGVVVDDAAVTPAYVHDLAASRELPIVWRIAKISLRNKCLFLLPAALLLGFADRRVLAALLLLGSLYLMFEASAKLTGSHGEKSAPADESAIVRKASRTDLVLSAEIMAISLAEVSHEPLAVQAAALAIVAVVMTVGVYGVVACVVKGDDVGARLASSARPSLMLLGRLLVKCTLLVLRLLAIVGVAAMCWVGGHIFLEQLAEFSFPAPYDMLHDLVHNLVPTPFLVWLFETVAYALVGLAGAACFALLTRLRTHA